MKLFFLQLHLPTSCWWWSRNALAEAQTLMHVLWHLNYKGKKSIQLFVLQSAE